VGRVLEKESQTVENRMANYCVLGCHVRWRNSANGGCARDLESTSCRSGHLRVGADSIVAVIFNVAQDTANDVEKGRHRGDPGRALVQAVSTGAPGKSSGLANEDRKTVRSSSMEVVAKNPRDSSETIRQLAERAGGFLVSSDFYGSQQASSAALQIRVPENKFEEVRAEIRKLGLRVESEKLQSEDVTKQYVDEAARLRNLHAQETQYLGILKQAKTVKDTLEVSDQLNRIRQEIEQQQAEFEALSKQVETVALTIALRAEADARVFGLNWRPLYQLKLAARQGLESLGDYASAMGSFLFYLPTVLLWLATILIGAAIGWRILRWSGRLLFMPAGRPV
jgi:molecular chaperone GrpE (heat shock protein)